MFDHFYHTRSAGDKCTLFSDRNLVDRRNVKADVDKAANPCRKFLEMEVHARIISACLQTLGLNSMHETPASNILPNGLQDAMPKAKREFLHKIASQVVDKYILQKENVQCLLKKVLTQDEIQQYWLKDMTPDGRFKCRYPSCPQTFTFDAASRRIHENNHDPPVCAIYDVSPEVVDAQLSAEEHDDMFNYQCSFLELSMIILNFLDAIKEGDGLRVLRCWKFMLPYLHHHKGSTKYALEALFLIFQANALLSPRDAHRLVWNRFALLKKGMGGNIPLDLHLEFMHKILKEVVRKLGPNASNKKCIDRYAHSLDVNSVILANFDANCHITKRSGKHTRKSQSSDLDKVVQQLMEQKALTFTPGRAYGHFSNIEPTVLNNFNLQKMYKWINKHKRNILLQTHAR